MASKPSPQTFQDVFVARQPVFNTKKRVWGYELLYRDGAESVCAEFTDQDAATLSVTDSATLWPFADLSPQTKILVNFASKSILNNVPYALPAANTVIQVPENCPPTPLLLDSLRRLKFDGYGLAVDDFTGSPEATHWLELADLCIVDLLNLDKDTLKAVRDSMKGKDILLLAKKVETPRAFELAANAGFHLFQGFFFKKPEILPDRKLPAAETAKLKLFEIIERPEPDFDALAEAMQCDVSISYRLLRYLNSPFFGLIKEVSTIKQASVLLGWNQVRSWLRVIILTDLASGAASDELPFHSTQRGRFFQLLCSEKQQCSPDSLFLLGLFSMLDAMLQQPMEDIVKLLPLEPALAQALVKGPSSYGNWLSMAAAYEAGDWRKLDNLIDDLGLDPIIVARAYAEATSWANMYFGRNL